ncbi:hypothetical protein [Ciceribacter thiooxidans]|uniref:Uncharacterized protein n=1 Tax=Ciceribacter thiooxidans TaxID=1969821 RepID=A0ABV7I3U6_9HYPH|nr:hypothetical protein [Ciceribacter thiooxidans]
MDEHFSECSVYPPDQARLIENVSLRMSALGASIVLNDSETVFLLDEGVAVMKSVNGRLLMQVSAANIIVLRALKIAFEASIFDASAVVPAEFFWCPG